MVESSTQKIYDLTKNFNQKFEKYFDQNKKLNKQSILSKIDILMDSFYKNETSSFNSKTNEIDFIKLEKFIQELLHSYQVYTIGSVPNYLVTNSTQRSYSPDILLVPNNELLKDHTLRIELLGLKDENYSFLDENEEIIIQNSLNLKLFCEKIGLNVSTRILHQQNDLYLCSNNNLTSIFKLDIYKRLHVFVQKIFLNHFKISWSRFHISSLIVGFLNFKFPDSTKRSAKFSTITKIRTNKRLGRKMEMKEELEIYWYEYEENDLNSFGSCSRLLFEFLDFIKRLLLYYKTIITRISNPQSNVVFKNIEDEYLNFFDKKKILEDPNYMFNINFLVLKMKEKQQISFYQPKADQISKLLFALLENHEKLEEYRNVIDIVELILK